MSQWLVTKLIIFPAYMFRGDQETKFYCKCGALIMARYKFIKNSQVKFVDKNL